jgi:hypothetical protein
LPALYSLPHLSSFLQVYHDDYTFGFRAQLAIITTTLGPCLDRITFSPNTPSILEKHSSRLVSNHVLVFLYFLLRSGMNYCVNFVGVMESTWMSGRLLVLRGKAVFAFACLTGISAFCFSCVTR